MRPPAPRRACEVSELIFTSGTSDAPMTVMQQLPTDGAVLVSTPQGLATMVVSKAIQMVKKFEVPIVGVVESAVVAPDSL